MRFLAACVAFALLSGCSIFPSGPAPVVDRKPAATVPAAGSYVVQKGDTLYAIAFRHGSDFRDIAKLNGIGPPYRIYAGQRLKLTGIVPPAVVAEKPPAAAGKGKRGTVKAPPPEDDSPEQYPSEVSWRWPVEGPLLHGFTDDVTGKKGIGIGGEEGAAVAAAAAGRVVYAGGGLAGYGNLIIIKHNESYLSAYAHNRALLVKEGEQVRSGQKIAEMGRSPQEQVLLHFEIRRGGKPVDPMSLLPRSG
jgi:lipoprotein NlpD